VLWTKHAGAKKLGGFAVKQQHNFKLIIWSFCSVCFYVGRICISFVWLQYISRRKQWGWKLAWSNKITSAPVNRFICFFLYPKDHIIVTKNRLCCLQRASFSLRSRLPPNSGNTKTLGKRTRFSWRPKLCFDFWQPVYFSKRPKKPVWKFFTFKRKALIAFLLMFWCKN